jgi:hypothetical protein
VDLAMAAMVALVALALMAQVALAWVALLARVALDLAVTAVIPKRGSKVHGHS